MTITYGSDIGGYIPGRDPRRVTSISVVDGQNFLMDEDGPRAAYAHSRFFTSQIAPSNTNHVGGFICGDYELVATPDGLFYVDETSKLLKMFIDIDSTKPLWPWTMAFVGGKYYFAQYCVGLFEYDPDTDTRRKVLDLYDETIIGICESYGRLIMLTTELVVWSAQDDGGDMTPTLSTGAGWQSLKLIGGDPLCVFPVDAGVIVVTTKGILKGTSVDEEYVWSWHVGNTSLRLKSPTAACLINDVGVLFCDQNGLKIVDITETSSVEVTLTEFNSEMSQRLKKNYLSLSRMSELANVMLTYHNEERSVYLSLSTSGEQGVYTETFVYYLPTKKWGEWNEHYVGLLELEDSDGNLRTCFCTLYGFIYRFEDQYYSEAALSQYDVTDRAYFAPDWGQCFLYAEDTTNERTEDSSTGELTYTLEQNETYVCIDDLFYLEQPKQAYMPENTVSGMVETTYEQYGTETDIVDGYLSLTYDNTDDTTSFTLSGLVDENTYDGDMRYDVSSYVPDYVTLDSYIEVGPIRFISENAEKEIFTIPGFSIGHYSLGSEGESEDWNTGINTSEDWNDDSFISADDEDWGTGLSISYDFTTKMAITEDAYPDTEDWEKPFIVDETDHMTHYRTNCQVGYYGTLRLDTEDVGDFYYLHTFSFSGDVMGSLY